MCLSGFRQETICQETKAWMKRMEVLLTMIWAGTQGQMRPLYRHPELSALSRSHSHPQMSRYQEVQQCSKAQREPPLRRSQLLAELAGSFPDSGKGYCSGERLFRRATQLHKAQNSPPGSQQSDAKQTGLHWGELGWEGVEAVVGVLT